MYERIAYVLAALLFAVLMTGCQTAGYGVHNDLSHGFSMANGPENGPKNPLCCDICNGNIICGSVYTAIVKTEKRIDESGNIYVDDSEFIEIACDSCKLSGK